MFEKLDMKELTLDLLDREVSFHLLKHFRKVDDKYMETLCKDPEYTTDRITEQMERPGSKFNPSWVSNPHDLIRALWIKLKAQNMDARWISDRCVLELTFDRKEFPDGIGTDNLISIDEIPEQERANIREEPTDIIGLKTIIYTPEKTWKLHLILGRIEDKTSILTIFPGKYAPMFPDPELQSNEEYLISKTFWENHVLIVEE